MPVAAKPLFRPDVLHTHVQAFILPATLAAGQPPRYTVAVEVKGPQDPLDRPFAGRRLSAVDQGYRYAINLPCDWLIVTSMREIRLHSKAADQHTYEAFDTEAVARGRSGRIFAGCWRP